MYNNNEMLSSRELALVFEKILTSSGYLILSIAQQKNGFTLFEVENNGIKMNVYANIRNIGSAYLPNKPFILRRQVGKLNFDDIQINRPNSLSMLLAIGKIEDNYVLSCWNPFYFVGHATNRSCYVLDSSLETAIKSGLYAGDDCKTPVLVCNMVNFERLMKIYIERNVID